MTYRIQSIELYVRETPPGRMAFVLGKGNQKKQNPQGLINPIGHVRVVVRDEAGHESFGCAADRLSVRWLDKRSGRSFDQKRRALVRLINFGKEAWLAQKSFETPFDGWLHVHPQIMTHGQSLGEENLTSSFVSALFERAVVDAVCRLREVPLFVALRQGQLGFEPGRLHPDLVGWKTEKLFAGLPRTRFSIRHTVGLADPLTDADLPDARRVNDGLPETLEEYLREDGIRFFKVKISGNTVADLERLAAIWAVVARTDEPVLTLDANEAYADLDEFTRFVTRLERDQLGLFQHIAYIEQPLPRGLTLDSNTSKSVRKIAEMKPLLIDEADGTTDSFRRAREIGYQGTSHKNCKGFFKSLANHAVVQWANERGKQSFLSGEDLQNLPVVPLQQDFATLGLLGLGHCERNGHHYNYGLRLLSEKDRRNALKRHPDLYVTRDDEAFLNIREGAVECVSIHLGPGFGVMDEPDWESMETMDQWLVRRHPA